MGGPSNQSNDNEKSVTWTPSSERTEQVTAASNRPAADESKGGSSEQLEALEDEKGLENPACGGDARGDHPAPLEEELLDFESFSAEEEVQVCSLFPCSKNMRDRAS